MNETGHLTGEERVGYWQRTLAPQALLELSDHLKECARCREELRRDQPSVASTDVVGYEDLVAWMDGGLDPQRRRALAERIGNSPATAAELVNLLQFRDEMNELPAHDYSAAPLQRSRWGRGWALLLAAGFALGCALLWWNATGEKAGAGVALVDHGKRLIVRADGGIPALGPLPSGLQHSVKDAMSLGQVDRPTFWDDLRGPREALAGKSVPEGSFRVVAPVGSVVEMERPTFCWSSEPGATGYRVNYLPKGGGAVMSSPLLPATATSWTPNESLLPNETYEWEVEALKNGETLAKSPAPPEPEARFRVLNPASRADLQRLRAEWGASHLIMGLAYARIGLVTEARREFEELARENPQIQLPRKLLASLTTPTE